jgi:hypothetical protein
MGRRRKGTEPRPAALEGGLGLARVEPLFELATDELAAREHVFVAHSAWRQLHEPDVLVTLSMAARVRRSLIQGPQAVALPPSPHDLLTPTRRKGRKIPAAGLAGRSLRQKRQGRLGPARTRSPRILRSRTRACSSRGSSPCPSERNTYVPRPPAGARIGRVQKDGVPVTPSGTVRGTGRSARSAEVVTRTTRPPPPACSEGRRRHRLQGVATRPPFALTRACGGGGG